MNKRLKIIIIASVCLIILIIIALVVLINRQNLGLLGKPVAEKFTPDFLSLEEKQSIGIPAEANIQVISRDSEGGVSVYKVVNSEGEAINPQEVKPISPRSNK